MTAGVTRERNRAHARHDTWHAPLQALDVLTSMIRDAGRVLLRAGVPILTLSLLAFVGHGWLIDRSARLAMDNGPLGLAVLIAAITRPQALLALVAFVVAVPAVRAIRSGAQGPALIPVLAGTGMLTLVYALLLTLGLAL